MSYFFRTRKIEAIMDAVDPARTFKGGTSEGAVKAWETRRSGQVSSERSVVHAPGEISGDKALAWMRRMEKQGFKPIATTTANGVTEKLTTQQLAKSWVPGGTRTFVVSAYKPLGKTS